MKRETSHLSIKPQLIKPETKRILMGEHEQRLDFLKRQKKLLDENLTEEEKSDRIISAKLQAISEKISQLENLIKQLGEAFEKSNREAQALIDSLGKDDQY